MSERYRHTWLEILLDNIYANFRTLQDHIAPTKVVPVVKADAYGHGAVRVVGHLRRRGIKRFAVAILEEALEIKRAFPDVSVHVMGVPDPADFPAYANYDIELTVSQPGVLKALMQSEHSLRVHLKLDTGMNRLGFKQISEAVAAYQQLTLDPQISVEGVFTHFATADSDKPYVDWQWSRFERFLEALPALPSMVHVSNTSAAMKHESGFRDTTHARIGIGLYGTSLESDWKERLQTTYVLKSRIVEVKHLKKQEKIGYGITYEARDEERIGILPIGYADGFIRQNQGGDVFVNGGRRRIVGRICMDQMFIRLEDWDRLGDEVELIGEHLHIDEVADRLRTINYEVFTQISSRVPRIYYERTGSE